MKKHAQTKKKSWIALLFIIVVFIVAGIYIVYPLMNDNKEHQLDAIIKEVSEHTITITSEKDMDYIFNRDNVTFTGDPLDINGNIHLTYQGKLINNSHEIQKAILLKGEVKLPIKILDGVISDYTSNTMTISSNQKNYLFNIETDKIKTGTIQTENPIHIAYKGTLKEDGSIQSVLLQELNIEEISRSFEGTIISFNENAIAIKDNEGNEYLFARKNIKGDNLIVGYEAKVTYQGKIDNNNSDIQVLTINFIEIIKVNLGLNDPIISLIDSMSVDEKIGQMFMARCPTEDQAWFVSNYKIGGYILFARDFENKSAQTVTANIQSYQDASRIPLLIGTDEEGGTVVRVSRYFRDSIFQSPQTLYNQGGMNAILNDVDDKSSFLKSFGINVNFAPDADVSTNANDFMYDRSFGKSAQENADYVGQVVWRMKQNQIGSVLKHFPGYGNNGDTHTNICYDERSLESFRSSDFLPFIAGIENGAECILVNHNIVEAMDNQRPASLSPNVHSILRNELGYDKVIITDDLAMDGVAEYTDSNNIAVMAILAGNDILLTSDAPNQIEAVKEAVSNGTISLEQVNVSVERILRWKHNLGLL